MGDEGNPNYKVPQTVRLTIGVFYLSNYYKASNEGTVAKAIDKFAEHNLQLDVWPYAGAKGEGNCIEFEDRLVEERDHAAIYKQAKEILTKRCSFIIPVPVIYCQYVGPAYGKTVTVSGALTDMCFIQPVVNDDKMTLVHELGHAAGLNHDRTNSTPKNIMAEDEPRSMLMKWQVQQFSKAKFAVA
jgi:hypothetical protein